MNALLNECYCKAMSLLFSYLFCVTRFLKGNCIKKVKIFQTGVRTLVLDIYLCVTMGSTLVQFRLSEAFSTQIKPLFCCFVIFIQGFPL